MEGQEALFESRQFIEDERLLIPDVLKVAEGTFLNTWRYATVHLEEQPLVFTPVHLEDNGGEFSSDGYASTDDNFGESFQKWDIFKPSFKAITGYITGFPVLQEPDSDKKITCIQLWENNSDVRSLAISLRSLAGLCIYSELRTDIECDKDELAMGDTDSIFTIPMLTNTKTGKTHHRPATYDDLDRIIEELDEAPVSIYGFHPGISKVYRKNPIFLKELTQSIKEQTREVE